MAPKTRHHYVPRFLLKQFSEDRKRIDVFHLKKKKLLSNVGLKEQCYESNYYGKDNGIEDAFAALEDKTSQIIRTICQGDLDAVSENDLLLLRQFIVFQASRTKAAAEEADRSFTATSKAIMQKKFEIRGLPPGVPKNVMDLVELHLTQPQMLSLQMAVSTLPAIFDLQFKILVSKDNSEFIISDSPVVRYNQFAANHPRFSEIQGTHGFAQKGIQIFMPLSPRICIALFDCNTYEYGNPNKLISIIGNCDVKLLNTIQAVNADKCLYQSCTGPGELELAKLAEARDEILKTKKPTVRKSEPKKLPNGKTSQLIFTSGEDFKLPKKFSLVKVIDHNKYDHMSFLPPRSRELVAAIKAHEEDLKKMRTNPHGADSTLEKKG